MNINLIVETFLKFYSQNKHDIRLNQVTDYLLSETLKAKGYNNFKDNNETGELFFINQVLSKAKPELCIDIGANVGDFSREILLATSAQVIAFEPLPMLYDTLVQKTQAFKNRIKIEPCGVGSKNEHLSIAFNPKATSHASFAREVEKVFYLKNHQRITVPVTTLDTYVEKHNIKSIDLIKIDVEGFENEVFDGARETFQKCRPKFIQIEFNLHQLFRGTTLNFFSEKIPEYEVYQLLPGGWAKRDPKDPHSNIYAFSNFVFVLPGAI